MNPTSDQPLMFDLTLTINAIQISPELRTLLLKLRHCQDSKSGKQSFLGAIRVEIENNVPVLYVEETTWDTENGDKINTSALRA